MQAYTVFAGVYDGFMRDIPYGRWAEGAARLLGERGVSGGSLLELGCGTGSFTALMAQKGYKMTGIDLSPYMLREAQRKLGRGGAGIRLIRQDMRALEPDSVYGGVISVCDSMNYLRDVFDLESVFDGAAKALEPGGIFIFDLKTESFYRSLGNSVFTDETDQGCYIWENDYDGVSRDNNYYITFFLRGMFGRYRKYTEEHIQHAFTDAEVKECASKKGFRVAGARGADMEGPADRNGERVYYIMERI